MHLAFILFDYFPFGGLQRDCLKTATICEARGHSVTLLTRTWQGPSPAGLKVKLFGRDGWTNEQRNRKFLRQLQPVLAGFDGVVGFNKVPGLDLYYGSDPCYAGKVDRLKPFWFKWLPRYRHFRALEESVFQRGLKTELLLLTSGEIEIYQRYYGTERERFHLLPPGIEKRFPNAEDRARSRERVFKELGLGQDGRLLVFVGSGFRIKGLDRAITGMASLPEALRRQTHLAVIGQNKPERFGVLARQFGLSGQVHFLGGRNDVYDFLQAGDLLVHPAHSEAAGMILLEALTAGLPVLTTDTCGYAFHVERAGAGVILSSPFSQEKMNETLARMLAAPDTSRGVKGLDYAAREDLYSCQEKAASLIEQTVEAKLKSRAAGTH